jgi:hypothetical protein
MLAERQERDSAGVNQLSKKKRLNLMGKVARTFRIEAELSSKLNQIVEAPYTYTWHLEQALKNYAPIKKLMAKPVKSVAVTDKFNAAIAPGDINHSAWLEWMAAPCSKVTEASAKKQWKLLAAFTMDEQQLIIDTSINSGWRGLFALKGGQSKQGKSFAEEHFNSDWTEGL